MSATQFDPEIDRKRARLEGGVRQSLLADSRRIVIAGVSGWVGRTTAALLHEALGPDEFARRVACFGSRSATHDLGEGITVSQKPLDELGRLEHRPTLLFNLAFVTLDKVSQMDRDDYVRTNRAMSETIYSALEPIGVDRLFMASSGAAAFADDEGAAANLRLYGRLKREDEALFSKWALAAPATRRAVIARIYSLSGPWINKPEVYALASLISQALKGEPATVHAPMRVWRSYVAAREVVSLVLAALLAGEGSPVIRFDTGGEPLELAELATRVVEATGGVVERRPITSDLDNRYVGDDLSYRQLLHSYGLRHLPLGEQIAETAAFLARQNRVHRATGG